jgi:uncharacterized oxidoreductase
LQVDHGRLNLGAPVPYHRESRIRAQGRISMKLGGNTVVITGGSSGIGQELVRRFSAAGSAVVTCGRRADRLGALTAQLPNVATRALDLAVESDRAAFAAWVAAEHPRANVLINNAGTQRAADFTKPLDFTAVRAEVETNLLAPLHLANLFLPLLAGKPGAAIVNISSGLAFCPIAFMPVYCATKAAVHSFSLSLRRQAAPMGVAVFEIAPPSVDSELGHEHWRPGQASHGGMPVAAFVQEMLAALEADAFETAVGQAAGMREKREALFDALNNR